MALIQRWKRDAPRAILGVSEINSTQSMERTGENERQQEREPKQLTPSLLWVEHRARKSGSELLRALAL